MISRLTVGLVVHTIDFEQFLCAAEEAGRAGAGAAHGLAQRPVRSCSKINANRSNTATSGPVERSSQVNIVVDWAEMCCQLDGSLTCTGNGCCRSAVNS